MHSYVLQYFDLCDYKLSDWGGEKQQYKQMRIETHKQRLRGQMSDNKSSCLLPLHSKKRLRAKTYQILKPK